MIKIKPVSIFKSILPFAISSLIIYLGLYKGLPFFQARGMSFLEGYLIFFHIPLALLICTALILYRIEGNHWNWQDFTGRLRIKRISGKDWLWALGLLVFGLAVYAGLSPIGKWLAEIPFFSPPDFFPPELNPNKARVPGYMMDYKLSGEYWIIIVYFFAWITNILGEEFLFRGILFPRQIEKYGSKAWIFHGIIWTCWHFFWTWNLVSIFPFAMALSYVTYKRQNTSIPIIVHGVMNSIPLVLIMIEVIK